MPAAQVNTAVRAQHRPDTVATVDELVCSLLHASTRALLLRQSLTAAWAVGVVSGSRRNSMSPGTTIR